MTATTLTPPAIATNRKRDESPAELERRYGAANYHPLPVTLQRGAGVWLFDTAGRRYLDMAAGVAVSSLGHAHPRLVATIAEQAGRLMHVSNYFYNGVRFVADRAWTQGVVPGAPGPAGTDPPPPP